MKNNISTNEVIANHSLNTTGDIPTLPHVKCFNCGYDVPNDSSKSLFENYKEFVAHNKPYVLLITLPFDETFCADKNFEYGYYLFSQFEAYVQSETDFQKDLEYFVFVKTSEPLAGIDNSSNHINILVKYGYWYDSISNDKIRDIFKAAKSEVSARMNLVSKGRIISVLSMGEDVAIEFCFQHIEDKKLRGVKFFGNSEGYREILIGDLGKFHDRWGWSSTN